MIRLLILLFIAACIGLSITAGSRYEGNWLTYGLFTIASNALLLSGFRKNAIFFDTFIGIFLWLGFWLKLSIRLVFADGAFHEPIGSFNGSSTAYDTALIVSSCGFAGLLVATVLRNRFFRYPVESSACTSQGLFMLYKRHRRIFVTFFLLVVIGVAFTNLWLGIYQRGMVAQTTLPFGLNGIYKWLLQFGLASISAVIIRFEIELNRQATMMAILPPLLEGLLSNVSLLSRGMILNASALGIGGLRAIKLLKLRIDPAVVILTTLIFATFFVTSVFAVNFLRASSLLNFAETTEAAERARILKSAEAAKTMATPLLIDRWVGIEGVMAVSSSERLGWDLWNEAWQERFEEGRLTLYDRYFIESPYENPAIDKSKHHFVSLPGIIAFFYYPGSLWFLFLCMLAFGLGAALFEITTYKLAGKNLVLCSLFAQVIAFRYASFGYVPSQSYLLFGTLLINIFIIAGMNLALRRLFQPHNASD